MDAEIYIDDYDNEKEEDIIPRYSVSGGFNCWIKNEYGGKVKSKAVIQIRGVQGIETEQLQAEKLVYCYKNAQQREDNKNNVPKLTNFFKPAVHRIRDSLDYAYERNKLSGRRIPLFGKDTFRELLGKRPDPLGAHE